MPTRYPIRVAARLTGLSLDTLRAWERRYQAVVPDRSERGRQYGPAHIERLHRLNQLVRVGHPIGQIASLSNKQLSVLAASAAPSGPRVESPKLELIAPVVAAIERFDAGRAAGEMSRLAAFLPPRDLVYQAAMPLLREVGDRWHAGTMSVAQEALASGIVRDLLGSMMRLVRQTEASTRMVFATPQGEEHEFGILIAAMLASLSGVGPVYLGPSLPAKEIAGAARRTQAKAVVLGATVPAESTRGEIKTIAAALPRNVELWVGGAGGAAIDLAGIRGVHRVADLPSFENDCQRLTSLGR